MVKPGRPDTPFPAQLRQPPPIGPARARPAAVAGHWPPSGPCRVCGGGGRRHLEPGDFLSARLGRPSARRWPVSLLAAVPRARWPGSPSLLSPSPPAWVAAMSRKGRITDSYPAVKRREGPAGHGKGELAHELGL